MGERNAKGGAAMLLMHAVIPAEESFLTDMCVRLADGRITETGKALTPMADEMVIDLAGDYLLPGFVDVHIHAFKGNDAMDGEDAVRAMSRELCREGVAAFLPTTMSASQEDTRRDIAAVRAVMDKPEPMGARVLGAHMEAPFLNVV